MESARRAGAGYCSRSTMANDAATAPRFSAAPPASRMAAVRRLAPGIALSALVALFAYCAEPFTVAALRGVTGTSIGIPAVVLALVAGMALNPVAARPRWEPGMAFCVKKLLRIAIALLGVRIALGDIAALGAGTAILVVLAMAATIVSGVLLARLFGRDDAFGALAGAATAVCGASAALATASVLPRTETRDADTVFTVVAVNFLSTVAMLAYPPLASAMGMDALHTGILLGATIHDVAQVVGAGYGVSETAGNTAVVVKLFRVFLLLPVVIGIGWWFARSGGDAGRARVPVPVFAIVFLVLALVNSLGLVPAPAKAVAGEVSRWGLLVAIAALGLGTSVTAIMRVGWKPVVIVCGTTTVIFAVVAAGLPLLR